MKKQWVPPRVKRLVAGSAEGGQGRIPDAGCTPQGS